MDSSKKSILIIADYEHILRFVIDKYNDIYDTDFEISEFVIDGVGKATVDYLKATEADVFHLATNYGRMSEVFDKQMAATLPPDFFENKDLFPG